MSTLTLTDSLQTALLVLAMLLLSAAVWRDVATRLISNRVVLCVAGLGLVLRLLQGDALYAVPCALLVFVAAMACWQLHWLGGGDVKLITAACLLPPAHEIALQLLAITLAGGALAVAVVYLRPLATTLPMPVAPGRNPLKRVWRAEVWRLRHGGSLPYAFAIAVGTLACLLTAGWSGS